MLRFCSRLALVPPLSLSLCLLWALLPEGPPSLPLVLCSGVAATRGLGRTFQDVYVVVVEVSLQLMAQQQPSPFLHRGVEPTGEAHSG